MENEILEDEEKEKMTTRDGKIELVVNETVAVNDMESIFVGEERCETEERRTYREYYDSLWPSILKENIYHISSKKKCIDRDLDELCFYGWGVEVEEEEECARVYRRANSSSSEDYERASMPDDISYDYINEKDLDNNFVQEPYRTPKVPVLSLEHHLHAIECDRKLREKLAKDFTLREHPWYIKLPAYERQFNLTEEQQLIFCEPFEHEILRNIYKYRTRFMIVFNGVDVPLGNYECWLKFKLYVAVIVVVQTKERHQQLKHSACFHGVALSEELEDNLWQDELARGLKAGVDLAKSLYIYQEHGTPFIYVFPNHRNICVVNNFKVLRHN